MLGRRMRHAAVWLKIKPTRRPKGWIPVMVDFHQQPFGYVSQNMSDERGCQSLSLSLGTVALAEPVSLCMIC